MCPFHGALTIRQTCRRLERSAPRAGIGGRLRRRLTFYDTADPWYVWWSMGWRWWAVVDVEAPGLDR